MEMEQAALMMKENHEAIDSDDIDEEPSDESSDDDDTTSDDDEKTTSDDSDADSSDEGNSIESEDVISKLTDVASVRSKKPSSSLHEKESLKTVHQYGYPDILRDEKPHSASAKEDFDDKQDESEKRLTSNSSENTSALTSKLMILNPHVEERKHCKLIEEIQDGKEEQNKRSNVDDISTAVQNITLSNSEEEQRQDRDPCHMSSTMVCGLQSSDDFGCQDDSVICKKRTVSNDDKYVCTAENHDAKDDDLQEQNVVKNLDFDSNENGMDSKQGENSLNCDQDALETWIKSPPRQKIELFEDN